MIFLKKIILISTFSHNNHYDFHYIHVTYNIYVQTNNRNNLLYIIH